MGTCQSCVVKIEEHARPQATTETGRPWRYRLASAPEVGYRVEALQPESGNAARAGQKRSGVRQTM